MHQRKQPPSPLRGAALVIDPCRADLLDTQPKEHRCGDGNA